MFDLFKKKINLEKKSDPENGIFVLQGQVCDELACNVIKGMFNFSDKYPSQTITVYINCEGGSVTAGMAVYDVMRALPNPIRTIAAETVGGIGAVILAAGTQGMRFAYAKTQITLGAFDGNGENTQHPELIYSAIQKVYGVLTKHTGRSVAEIKEKYVAGIGMSVKEAMQFGIIDKKFIDKRIAFDTIILEESPADKWTFKKR